MDDDWYVKLLWVVAVAILLACVSLLIVASNLGKDLVSSWMLVLFHIVISVAAVLVVGTLVAALMFLGAAFVSMLFEGIVNRLGDLERRYRDLTKRLEQRTPTFVSTATIIAAMVMLLSDKAFGEEKTPAVCIGIVLILFFWVANELLVAGTRGRYIVGIVVWFLGIALTPTVMLIQEHGDVSKLVHGILKLNLAIVATVVASIVLACVAPLTLKIKRIR